MFRRWILEKRTQRRNSIGEKGMAMRIVFDAGIINKELAEISIEAHIEKKEGVPVVKMIQTETPEDASKLNDKASGILIREIEDKLKIDLFGSLGFE